MKQRELNLIIYEHKKWLSGIGGKKANLYGADLREANLCGANLREADLRFADLRGANLCGANLCDADLREANLRFADLRFADLRGADLRGANLCDADLREADLRFADLRGANLCEAGKKKIICDGTFHHLTNVGSEKGVLELYSCGDYGWFIKRGCFSGSKQQFIDAVNKTHKDNEHAKKYLAIIEALCD